MALASCEKRSLNRVVTSETGADVDVATADQIVELVAVPAIPGEECELEDHLDTDDERDRLAAGALLQAQEFSWDATADQTLGVYRRARSLMRASLNAS